MKFLLYLLLTNGAVQLGGFWPDYDTCFAAGFKTGQERLHSHYCIRE